MASKPKNLIILTSDEMRGDCPSFMGNPDCKTPRLDAFARRAVVFERHFAVHSKCVPSRISMVTGRYCHTDGFRTIYQHLPPDQPNLLGKLKECGYESAVFGLNHVWETLFASNEKGKGYADYHSLLDLGPPRSVALPGRLARVTVVGAARAVCGPRPRRIPSGRSGRGTPSSGAALRRGATARGVAG